MPVPVTLITCCAFFCILPLTVMHYMFYASTCDAILYFGNTADAIFARTCFACVSTSDICTFDALFCVAIIELAFARKCVTLNLP